MYKAKRTQKYTTSIVRRFAPAVQGMQYYLVYVVRCAVERHVLEHSNTNVKPRRVKPKTEKSKNVFFNLHCTVGS